MGKGDYESGWFNRNRMLHDARSNKAFRFDFFSLLFVAQLLLQMSQLIDIAFIGDTSSKYEQELVAQVDELSLRLCECEETGA